MRESAGVVLKATPNPAIARTLNLAGAVVSVGAFFLQGPFIPVTVLLAVLPVMACLLFFQTNGGYDAFIGCSLALMLRSIKDLPLLSFIPTLLVALAGG
jgi:anaerobic C4-dicarboxylate transporter